MARKHDIRRFVLVVLGIPLALVGAWSLLNAFVRGAVPAVLWTEADLPALPPAAENGWDVFVDRIEGIERVSIPSRLARLCAARSPKDAAIAKRVREGSGWEAVRASSAAILSLTTEPGASSLSKAFAAASRLPHFAVTCPVDRIAACPVMRLWDAHRMRELLLLRAGLDGRCSDALAGAASLIRVDAAFMASARRTLDLMMAVGEAERALRLTELLLVGCEAEADQPNNVSKLREALDRLRPEDVEPRRVVIAEYLFSMKVLGLFSGSVGNGSRGAGSGGAGSGGDIGPRGRGLGLPYVPPFFFDPGLTLQVLNERFEAFADYAASPEDREPPQFPARPGGFFWWLRNPVGNMLIATVHPFQMVENVADLARRRTALIRSRNRLRASLAASSELHETPGY